MPTRSVGWGGARAEPAVVVIAWVGRPTCQGVLPAALSVNGGKYNAGWVEQLGTLCVKPTCPDGYDLTGDSLSCVKRTCDGNYAVGTAKANPDWGSGVPTATNVAYKSYGIMCQLDNCPPGRLIAMPGSSSLYVVD